jgi:hypothetical protein
LERRPPLADADWDLLDTARLQTALDADDGFSLLRRDDFIVGLAFAQLLALLEPSLSRQLKKLRKTRWRH